MIPYFKSLGNSVERAWRESSYDEEVFPSLALAALEKSPPTEHVGVSDIIDWVFGADHDFQQPQYGHFFGEPPVMLFQAPRFYIEALFWLSNTTAIHEHSFSGAFTVLAGSSVHSHWSFSPGRAVNSRMICGSLERLSTEILRPGGIRPIHAGDRLIHQLFHLDLPSVTIVMRTYEERHHMPQYRYLPPGLAVNLEDTESLRTRRLMLLDGMARGQIGGLPDYAKRLVEAGDLEAVFYCFSGLTKSKVNESLLEELYRMARKRYGDIIDLFRRACEEERRTRIVTALRAKVVDPELRFLLALLMLMPDKEAIFEAIRLQFPGVEPLSAIESWLKGMSGKDTIGFEMDEVNQLLFRGLVEGLDEDGLLQRLRAEFDEASLETHRDRISGHVKKLARSELLRPLLSASPLYREVTMA